MTGPVKPPARLTLTESRALSPCRIVRLAGTAASVKLGVEALSTTMVSAVRRVSDPLVAVIVG